MQMFGCWDVSTHLSTGGNLCLVFFIPQQAAERGSYSVIPAHPILSRLWMGDFVINDTPAAALVEIFRCKFQHIKGVWLFWHPHSSSVPKQCSILHLSKEIKFLPRGYDVSKTERIWWEMTRSSGEGRVGKRKQKRQIEKGKGTVLSWEDKPSFFISVCKVFSQDYLSLGYFKLFFLIILFSSSTSSGPCFPYSAW